MASKQKKQNTNSEENTAVDVNESVEETCAEAEDVQVIDEVSEAENEMQSKISELEAAVAESKDSYLRLLAEFDNYKKRNAKLKTEAYDDGICEAIKQLLMTLDNFDRALSSPCSDESFLKGITLVKKSMMDSLNKLGLEEIQADGAFDPNVHEAIALEEKEGVESGMITEVLLKGYKVNNRIIRHSMVKVAQ